MPTTLTRLILVALALLPPASACGPTPAAREGLHGSNGLRPSRPSAVDPADIRQIVDAGRHPDLRWPEFSYYEGHLRQLYEPRAYEPLWFVGEAPTSAARQLLAALAGLGGQGLSPADYDVAFLDGAIGRADRRALPTGEVARADAALSLSLMRALTDLRFGRVDPHRLGYDYDVAHPTQDLAGQVAAAVETGRIAAALRDAPPRLPQYQRLAAWLGRYRRLAADGAQAPLPRADRVEPGDDYGGTLELARRLHRVGDLPEDPDIAADLGYQGPLVDAVRSFQERHGLQVDGILGRATFRALDAPLALRVRQLELALERLRWVPPLPRQPLLAVNVPDFHLYGVNSPYDEDPPAVQMDVIVGRAARTQTPAFVDEMTHLIFRPAWYPPASIIRNEILPSLAQDPGYLDRERLDIVASTDDRAVALPVTPENLALVRRGVLALRQRPGPANALGLVKFIFPNHYSVYLHDTPTRSLFARARRDFSHGCIRVSDPAGLAEFVLRDAPGWTRARIEEAMHGTRTMRVDLPRPVPVVIFYTTAIARFDGRVGFFEDIYGRDAELEAALAAGGRDGG